MKMEIGFGVTPQPLEVPDQNLVGVLMQNELPPVTKSEEEIVADAMANPIGTPHLKDIVKPGEKIAIITSDITRPVPTYRILPVLLEELQEVGIPLEDMVLVFALGSHRPHTEEEHKKLMGDSYGKIACVDSGQDGFVHLGATKHGTPVDICKIVAEADRRICLGNVEFHWFAGYSGGAKAIMPGSSTREAIQSNHSLMVEEGCVAGSLDNNPLRQDLEEAIQYCPIDFIINVVLSETKHITYASAGHFIDAHRDACRVLDKAYRKEIDAKADIVVVSQGGAPKDLNLYQTQKALDNAKHAVKEGGIVVLVGSCKEGFGEGTFEKWMVEATKPEDLIQRVREDFQLGGHKAAGIALVEVMSQIFLVSEMDKQTVKDIFMRPFDTVQEAFDEALKIKGEDATVLVMPYGGATLPIVKSKID